MADCKCMVLDKKTGETRNCKLPPNASGYCTGHQKKGCNSASNASNGSDGTNPKPDASAASAASGAWVGPAFSTVGWALSSGVKGLATGAVNTAKGAHYLGKKAVEYAPILAPVATGVVNLGKGAVNLGEKVLNKVVTQYPVPDSMKSLDFRNYLVNMVKLKQKRLDIIKMFRDAQTKQLISPEDFTKFYSLDAADKKLFATKKELQQMVIDNGDYEQQTAFRNLQKFMNDPVFFGLDEKEKDTKTKFGDASQDRLNLTLGKWLGVTETIAGTGTAVLSVMDLFQKTQNVGTSSLVPTSSIMSSASYANAYPAVAMTFGVAGAAGALDGTRRTLYAIKSKDKEKARTDNACFSLGAYIIAEGGKGICSGLYNADGFAQLDPVQKETVSKVARDYNDAMLESFTGNQGVVNKIITLESGVFKSKMAKETIEGKARIKIQILKNEIASFVQPLKSSYDEFMKGVIANQDSTRALFLKYQDNAKLAELVSDLYSKYMLQMNQSALNKEQQDAELKNIVLYMSKSTNTHIVKLSVKEIELLEESNGYAPLYLDFIIKIIALMSKRFKDVIKEIETINKEFINMHQRLDVWCSGFQHFVSDLKTELKWFAIANDAERHACEQDMIDRIDNELTKTFNKFKEDNSSKQMAEIEFNTKYKKLLIDKISIEELCADRLKEFFHESVFEVKRQDAVAKEKDAAVLKRLQKEEDDRIELAKKIRDDKKKIDDEIISVSDKLEKQIEKLSKAEEKKKEFETTIQLNTNQIQNNVVNIDSKKLELTGLEGDLRTYQAQISKQGTGTDDLLGIEILIPPETNTLNEQKERELNDEIRKMTETNERLRDENVAHQVDIDIIENDIQDLNKQIPETQQQLILLQQKSAAVQQGGRYRKYHTRKNRNTRNTRSIRNIRKNRSTRNTYNTRNSRNTRR